MAHWLLYGSDLPEHNGQPSIIRNLEAMGTSTASLTPGFLPSRRLPCERASYPAFRKIHSVLQQALEP